MDEKESSESDDDEDDIFQASKMINVKYIRDRYKRHL